MTEVEMERLLLTLISAVYALNNGEEIDPAERLYLRYTELQLRQKLDGLPFPSGNTDA